MNITTVIEDRTAEVQCKLSMMNRQRNLAHNQQDYALFEKLTLPMRLVENELEFLIDLCKRLGLEPPSPEPSQEPSKIKTQDQVNQINRGY